MVKEFFLPCDASNLCLSDSVPFRIAFSGSSHATDDLLPYESLQAVYGTQQEKKALSNRRLIFICYETIEKDLSLHNVFTTVQYRFCHLIKSP